MASIRKRTKKDGSSSYMVLWRDPKSREQQGITVPTLVEAETLKRLLDANGQSFEIAQHAILSNEKRTPTVAEVIQEHIDLLIRPSSGTTKTYQTMLDLHIRNIIGHVPVDKLDYRLIAHWVKSMMAKGKAPKTIHNVHGLISAAMNTAEMLGYIPKNPCRGVQLPGIEKAEDEAMFLTHAEFSLIMEGMGERYKAFTNFLVMTGTRFGEATALTVADVDLLSKPPTARINKAWKRDGQNQFYVGATKTGAGKRTIGLNPALVELLIPLVASRPGKELVFTTPKGDRIIHKLYWHHYWVPAVHTAQAIGLTKNPRIHDLRHTHASWLIQDGVPMFTISRRLGHASTRTTEQVYGHLMPEALQAGADATELVDNGLPALAKVLASASPAGCVPQGAFRLSRASGHVDQSRLVHESGKQRLPFGDDVEIEFFEPAEAAALMRCTESWLRDGATSGRFPHACWGKGKIIFTSEHILEIAKLSEILPGGTGAPLSVDGPAGKERLIGTRSKARLTTVH